MTGVAEAIPISFEANDYEAPFRKIINNFSPQDQVM
jgi:hypothetical protein